MYTGIQASAIWSDIHGHLANGFVVTNQVCRPGNIHVSSAICRYIYSHVTLATLALNNWLWTVYQYRQTVMFLKEKVNIHLKTDAFVQNEIFLSISPFVSRSTQLWIFTKGRTNYFSTIYQHYTIYIGILQSHKDFNYLVPDQKCLRGEKCGLSRQLVSEPLCYVLVT